MQFCLRCFDWTSLQKIWLQLRVESSMVVKQCRERMPNSFARGQLGLGRDPQSYICPQEKKLRLLQNFCANKGFQLLLIMPRYRCGIGLWLQSSVWNLTMCPVRDYSALKYWFLCSCQKLICERSTMDFMQAHCRFVSMKLSFTNHFYWHYVELQECQIGSMYSS